MTLVMNGSDERFERVAACPACGGAGFGPWRKGSVDPATIGPESFRITDSQYGITWDLGRCDDCGHVFADPCPTSEFIGTLYAALEDPLYDEEAGGRGNNFTTIIDHLDRLAPAKGRLFDVGAATGIFMSLASGRGWDVDGIEPGAWAVRTALEKHGIRIRRGTLEGMSLEPGAYDAVTMIDFIEHTARPLEALRKAAAILKPDGLLCLVTPDIGSPAARIAGKTWWHFRPAHLGYFTRTSVDAILARAGFSVVRRRGYAWHFSAHYLASRKPALRFLIRNARLAAFLKRIPIKLALGDSFEIYARKAGAR
jgi:SAM-dependent methyltransferase